MIIGQEFAKLFSENEELNEKMFSTGNEELDTLLEKVYSEGVEDGYDYAQKELRQVNFSNPDEKMIALLAKDEEGLADMKKQYKNALKNKDLSDKDRKNLEGLLSTVEAVEDPESVDKKNQSAKQAKMKLGDRINMSLNYAGMKEGSDREKFERRRLKGVPSTEKDNSRKRKAAVISTGIGGTIGGAVAGKVLGGSNKEAALAAAAMGLSGITGAYVGSKLGEKLEPKVLEKRKELEKTDKNYRNSWKKQEDLLDVKLGKMSKEKFVKKWGGKLNGKDIKGSMNG